MTSQSLDTCPILKNSTLAVGPVPPTHLGAGAGGGSKLHPYEVQIGIFFI